MIYDSYDLWFQRNATISSALAKKRGLTLHYHFLWLLLFLEESSHYVIECESP